MLLGIDLFIEVLHQGWLTGPRGSPSAFETEFGWVVAGQTKSKLADQDNASHHSTLVVGDELLQRFWEIEENPRDQSNFSPEDQSVVKHFHDSHQQCLSDGRVVVPLPKKPHACQAIG